VIVPGVGQQPPQTGRRLGRCSVVGNDQQILAYADVPHRLLEDGDWWERMTATGARRPGEVGIQIHPERAGYVACFEVRPTGWSTKCPAHIGDDGQLIRAEQLG
jgi:hypothetical protein